MEEQEKFSTFFVDISKICSKVCSSRHMEVRVHVDTPQIFINLIIIIYYFFIYQSKLEHIQFYGIICILKRRSEKDQRSCTQSESPANGIEKVDVCRLNVLIWEAGRRSR